MGTTQPTTTSIAGLLTSLAETEDALRAFEAPGARSDAVERRAVLRRQAALVRTLHRRHAARELAAP